MNFLAHCALSVSASVRHAQLRRRRVPRRLRQRTRFPRSCRRDIQTGIRLHRRIDAFSAVQARHQDQRRSSAGDRHATARAGVRRSRRRSFPGAAFRNRARGAARGVRARIYVILGQHESLFPADAVRFSRFMRDHDLFGRYVDIDPIERAFRRIAQRLGREEVVRRIDGGVARRLSRVRRRIFCVTTRHCGARDRAGSPNG